MHVFVSFPALENARSQPWLAENTSQLADRMPSWQAMFRFFQNTKRSLDSLLSLITDLVTDGILFFRFFFRSRTSLSVEVLFLRKQLAFYEERQVQPRLLSVRLAPLLLSKCRVRNEPLGKLFFGSQHLGRFIHVFLATHIASGSER